MSDCIIMKKKFFSLQYKFFIYFLLLSIVPTIVTGIFSYRQSSKVIISKAKEINNQKLSSVTSNISSIMTHVNEVSHLIIQNDNVKSYLRGNSSKDASEVLSFLSPFVGYNNSISTIRIEGVDGKRLLIGDARETYSMTDEQKKKADALNGYYYWDTSALPGVGAKSIPVKTFSFTRQYRDMYSLSNQIGYISIDILESSITEEYRRHLSSEGSIFLIVNESGKVISSSSEKYVDAVLNLSDLETDELSKIGTHTLDEPYVMTAQQLNDVHWTIVDLTPTNQMLEDNQVISKIIWSVIFCNIIICVLLALYISIKKLAPLRALCRLINDAGQQTFKEYPGTTSNDEVGLLAMEFNKMSQQLENLLNKVYAAQLKQSEAEFNALQAQINPHFLYNTLDTIYWVCRLEHANEASELVKALGDTFRLSLNKGEGLITLRDELKHLNSYLVIQKKRCKTSVNVEIHVEQNPKLLNAKVIKLVLQPLVENAFIHGISNNTKDSFIKIIVKLEDNTIIYIIEDNGAGIDSEFVEQLNSQNNQIGFGIRNVNERIKLLFGDSYGITISSRLNYGTTILVKQPFNPVVK